jgi:hypothetical protein
VWRNQHWLVYAVRDPAPMVSGSGASVTRLGPNEVDLTVARPGVHLLRVRFTPYWQLSGVRGCVGRAPGGFTTLSLRGAGRARLVIAFSLGRVGAGSARCSANNTLG